jgi:hypothetical protein
LRAIAVPCVTRFLGGFFKVCQEASQSVVRS